MEAEFGMPQWVFGMTTYAFLGDADDLRRLHQRRHLASR